MRRYRLVPMLAAALSATLALSACAANSGQTPRTLTQIVTVTGTSPASETGSASGTTGITVVGPSGSAGGSGSATGSAAETGTGSGSGTVTGSTGAGSSGTGTAGSSSAPAAGSTTASSSAPTTTAASSTGKDQKVNPLHVSCTSLLDNNDIKKAIGATVSSASQRIVDVANAERKMTGRIKCYYGVKTGAKDHPVSVALAQYASAAAATEQMNVTVKSESSLGAAASTVEVSGKQAHVLLRDGGLIVLQYDTWTLSVAVENKIAAAAKLPAGLQQLATMVLARVLKNG